jgi:pimeloyl-ACP methyl ester carboxylesterase
MFEVRSRDGVLIRYDVVGSGPPLVMFHPSLSSSEIWRQLGYIDALANYFQLILPDARGHGRSDKPTRQDAYSLNRLVDDVIAVLDQLRIEQSHFFGYSLGGRVAFGCGARYPDRFRSLIIGAGLFEAQTGGFDRVTYSGALDTLTNLGIETFLNRWSTHADYALPASVETTFRQSDPASMVPFLRQMDADPSLESALPGIMTPALLFAGEHDEARLNASRAAFRRMPCAEISIVPDGTHLSTLFQREAILQFARPFLDRIEEDVLRTESAMATKTKESRS